MIKTKKMPMGSAILLALMDARNRISAYDLAQADKIQGLIENQLDDMTPIVTSEPDWIRSVLQDEVRETSDLLAQPITFAPGVPQDAIPFRTALRHGANSSRQPQQERWKRSTNTSAWPEVTQDERSQTDDKHLDRA